MGSLVIAKSSASLRRLARGEAKHKDSTRRPAATYTSTNQSMQADHVSDRTSISFE